jgi:hypothetical protein
MLKIIQHFSKHCSCHLQGVMVGRFWQPYIGQAVGGDLDLMVLIGGAEGRAAIQQNINNIQRGSSVKARGVHRIPAAKNYGQE